MALKSLRTGEKQFVRKDRSFKTFHSTHEISHSEIIILSADSSVGIATVYGLEGRNLIPGRVKIFLFSTASRPSLGPTQPPIHWVPGVLFPEVKWSRREADHSPPSTAEDKNGGAILPLPHPSSLLNYAQGQLCF
jgi:hypothetical protein